MEKPGRCGADSWPLILGSSALLAVLSVPLLAMQVSSEVDWNIFDFVVAASLLFSALLTTWFVRRLSRDPVYRLAAVITIGSVILLIWITGAVGIIGAPDNNANLLFGGVALLALLASPLTQGKAAGMRFVLVLMAIAQAVICALALASGWAGAGAHPAEILLGGGSFFAAFLLASVLFHVVARRQRAALSGA